MKGACKMRRADQVIDHLFGLFLVLFVLPVVVCTVFIHLPWLFLRPYLESDHRARHASERVYDAMEEV